ncbi:TPA: hypothetical protein N0F65_010592 [Lagenidium giganteum]|uniref:Uncharacterized protein n=1 Tax=Lagenidium giganteum TaxID=4803 RepID=A0AAV2ZD63_9STRA|nr:TPA: hypothetical protein N0F65_010592 [Lagenidium giganteum]
MFLHPNAQPFAPSMTACASIQKTAAVSKRELTSAGHVSLHRGSRRAWMKPTHPTVNADGDVDLDAPQPVFEFVQAPRFACWDQATLVECVRQRRQYEEKILTRCASTGEVYELSHAYSTISHGMCCAKNARQPRFGNHAPLLGAENAHIPDLDKLFKDKLRMDLKEEDTDARVLNYFVLFYQIVEEHGLEDMLGGRQVTGKGDEERMKLRCKFLVSQIAPEMLKVEVERLAIVHPKLKEDDLLLYTTLEERARELPHCCSGDEER